MKKDMRVKYGIAFNKTGVVSCLVFFSLLLHISFSWAEVIIVPDQYVYIQDAIDVAVSGDIVYVKPGTYPGDITMKDGVSLMGAGKETTEIPDKETTEIQGYIIGAGNTIFKGFTVTDDGSLSTRLYECTSCENVKIEDNAFIVNTTTYDYCGIYLSNVTSGEITNNSVNIVSSSTESSSTKSSSTKVSKKSLLKKTNIKPRKSNSLLSSFKVTGINISGGDVLCANNSLYLEGADIVQGILYSDTTHTIKNNIINTHSCNVDFPENSIAVEGTHPLDLNYNLLIAVASADPRNLESPLYVGSISENVNLNIGNLKGVDPCFVLSDPLDPSSPPESLLRLQHTSPAIDAADPTYYLYAMNVTNIGTYDSFAIVKNIREIQNLINEAQPGDTVYIEPGVYSFDVEPFLGQSFESPLSVVYSRSLMINKNITLKAIDPDPDNTVIRLYRRGFGGRCIVIMDPYYYVGSHIYSYRGFETVNDVTIEGITIDEKCRGSESIKIWVAQPMCYGTGDERYCVDGHWALFTSSGITSPIYNFSERLTLRNCKILSTNYKGSSIYTWPYDTELILDNTHVEGDITRESRERRYIHDNEVSVTIRYIYL